MSPSSDNRAGRCRSTPSRAVALLRNCSAARRTAVHRTFRDGSRSPPGSYRRPMSMAFRKPGRNLAPRSAKSGAEPGNLARRPMTMAARRVPRRRCRWRADTYRNDNSGRVASPWIHNGLHRTGIRLLSVVITCSDHPAVLFAPVRCRATFPSWSMARRRYQQTFSASRHCRCRTNRN